MRVPAALVACVLLLVASCASSGPGITGDLRNVGSVTVTFKASPARVHVGQPVRLTFKLANSAPAEEVLTFPSGQRYDFWATRSDREVWRWSSGRVFVQEVTQLRIGSQAAVSLSEVWTPERTGSYIVHGALKAKTYERELTGKLEVQ